MSYTYTQEIAATDTETTFVPSYARKSVRPKKVKTWMVLAPIAGIALIGGAAAMLMNSGGEVQPLAEPAAAPAAVSQPAPLSSTPLASDTVAVAPMTAPTPAAPVTRAEPVRRTEAAPVRRAAPAAVAAPAIQAPVEATGPRAYEASPMTAAPVAAAPATAAPSTPAPVSAPAPTIVVAPLS